MGQRQQRLVGQREQPSGDGWLARPSRGLAEPFNRDRALGDASEALLISVLVRGGSECQRVRNAFGVDRGRDGHR